MALIRLMLILALAACAGGAKTPQASLGTASLTAEALEGAARLPLATWTPEGTPRAVLIGLHGYGDYGASTFRQAGPYWAERGILTYAYDQRGFGRNTDFGEWAGAETMIEDAAAAVRAARARHPDLPVFVVGHSMGGGVALAAARAEPPDGLILAAPAVWGGEELGLHYRTLAWAGAVAVPDKRWTGEGMVEIQASDNIEVLRAQARDPMIIGAPSAREFMGLIRIMDRAVAEAPLIAGPTLVLYGDKDEVTPPEPIDALMPRLAGEAELKRYPDGWHLLFRDLNAEVVWRDVADWIEARS